MRRLIILTLITLLAAFEAQAQTAPQATPAKPAPVDVTQLAVNWVDRLNDLCNWRLSMTGTEEQADEVVNRMMELFAPDVIAQVPPHDEEQIGPLELNGTAQLRKWAEKFARSHVDLGFLVLRQTEKTVEGEHMVYSKPLPWGGLGVAFPILAPYSLRVNRDKFLVVGGVFLQYGEDQKIHRFQLYLSEKSPVRGGREQ